MLGETLGGPPVTPLLKDYWGIVQDMEHCVLYVSRKIYYNSTQDILQKNKIRPHFAFQDTIGSLISLVVKLQDTSVVMVNVTSDKITVTLLVINLSFKKVY